MILIDKSTSRIICNDLFPLGNLTEIGLIWWYEVKWVKDEQMWLVAPLSRIQELKEERNLLPMCCCVGRNDKDLIRDIVTGFRLL